MTISHPMESRPRRLAVAVGLFLGGIAVGSNPTRESVVAHAAAPPPQDPHAAGAAPSRNERGPESDRLRKLRLASEREADLGEGEPVDRGARCSMRPADLDKDRAPDRDRADRADRARDTRTRDARDRGRDSDRVRERAGDDDPLAGLRMPELPVPRHPRVLKYIRYFTESHEGRKFFVETLKRSGRFQEIIAKALRERGLPQELAAVVFIESSFSPAAVSTAGAAGLWQFMPHTARAYGLAVESSYDERASPWRASEAAAHHLADLYERFRSWDNALAAYNLGYDGLERRLDEYDTDDFWTLAESPGALPKETAQYVPKVLALAVVLANLDEYGFSDVDRAAPADASELAVPAGTSLALVARAAGTSLRALRELNPELLADAVPNRGAEVTVHVPRGGLARARVMLTKLIGDGKDEAVVSADFDWGHDDVRDGRSRLERTRASRSSDGREAREARPAMRLGFGLHRRPKTSRTDEMIARAKKYLTDRATDAQAKPDDPPSTADGGAASASANANANPNPNANTNANDQGERKAAQAATRAPGDERRATYRVQPGDSVKAIAIAHGLTIDQLLAQAGVSAPEQITAGTVLELRTAPPAARGPRGHRDLD